MSFFVLNNGYKDFSVLVRVVGDTLWLSLVLKKELLYVNKEKNSA